MVFNIAGALSKTIKPLEQPKGHREYTDFQITSADNPFGSLQAL
jgi:hypothetical protein